MKSSHPVRLPAELHAAANEAAATMSRSVPQQITHWARIGRELEASPEVSIEAVSEVLRGAGDYDGLNAKEQAVVRAGWSERMTALAEALRLDRQFAAAERPYVELGDEGAVIRREPAPRAAQRKRAAKA